jgi:tetratricopeptide (TPR) repeat protein
MLSAGGRTLIIKCKMCGGDIDFIPGATYGTCEYCGSTSTIPQAEDENKLNRYNRANHFRRQCEFDKAVAAYEKILEQDENDAEAHWGAVISRFGIEYVEDPATHQRIPTCHRVQVASILTDEDYLAAVENAPDEESRRIYQEEAARIAEIQKGILAISANEKPYDVFICYKETDENGQRTRDSQWAQDVYYGLTEQGLKVFFSRITLEDKLGQQYEPYIFAALNSAKVMVVVGSRPEYFNAVWVKNEWSRYLSLMKHDHKRLLIPCYRDMDPYDLPEELSMLQSQDMSKIGFMQDLLRGIQKVMQQPTSAPQGVRVETATVETNAPGVTSLLKRAALFLEDGDTASAREYYDRVLDIDPECAEAYMGKVCAETGCRKESDLGALNYCVDMRGDWQKAVRFASAAQKQKYEGYMANVRARVEEHCHELAIDCACAVAVGRGSCAKMDDALKSYRANCLTKGSESTDYSAEENASWHLAGYQSIRNTLAQMIADNDPRDVTEGMLKVAAAMFGQIKGEEERAQQCLVLAEQARQKVIYEKASARRAAIGMPDLMDAADLEALAKQFGQIPGYKDAKRQAEQCLQDAENVRENAYNDAVKAMQEAERSSCKWREAIQMLAREGLNGYRDVEELRKQGEQLYEECRNAEEKERKAKERKNKRLTVAFVLVVLIACVVGWFVVTRVIPNNKYQRAVTLRENGQYDDAIAAFAELGDYSDAAAQITETKYQQAVSLREAGEYESAIAVFASLNDYRDAETQIEEMKQEKYQQAVTLRENGQYEEAIAAFEKLGDYSDAEVKIKEIKYQQAMALRRSGQYDEAIAAFTALGNYGDAEMQIKEVKYQQAVELRENGQYDDAIVAFTELKDYSDAKTQIAEMKYQQGKAFLNVMDYDNAARILITIKGYKDVDKLLTENDDIMAISAEIMLDTKFTVGNYVTFGTYPQTALGNDQTPIEWLVLARDGRQALLISRYGLDAKPYNTKLSSTTWGKCTLRTWLNDTFLNKAFSSTEQTAILTTDVDNSKQQCYSGWNPSRENDTKDKVFLLSYAEANKYFGIQYVGTNVASQKARVAPTAYIEGKIYTYNESKTIDGQNAGTWWLRSPGKKSLDASVTTASGMFNSSDVNLVEIVRPALWVSIDSPIFRQ